MVQSSIYLNKIREIYDFVNLASMNTGDVKLIQGDCIINGKSISGILSLDLSSPIIIKIYEDKEHTPINQTLIRNLNRFAGDIQI